MSVKVTNKDRSDVWACVRSSLSPLASMSTQVNIMPLHDVHLLLCTHFKGCVCGVGGV